MADREELVRGGFAALGARDIGALLELMHPEIELEYATLHAKGRESGVEVDEPVAQRHLWRGDQVVKIEYVGRPKR